MGRNSRFLIELVDGTSIIRGDYHNQIEHVKLPMGKRITSYRGLPRDCCMLIGSILVVPWSTEMVTSEDAAIHGTVEFESHGRSYFSAPVVALANRYHGMTKAASIAARLQMLGIGDLSSGMLEIDTFPPVLKDPIFVVDGLPFSLRHHAEKITERTQLWYTVELQMLAKNPLPEKLDLRWEKVP